MPERIANTGYFAIAKETTKGTVAATPSIYVPLYDEKIAFNQGNVIDNPIVGQKYKSFQVLPGMRSYAGTLEVMAEPNTAGHLLNMLLTKGTTTGSAPYTHPFTLSAATAPVSYTADFAMGKMVYRYAGLEASEISPTYSDNEMHFNMKVSALKMMAVRKIVSISTTSVVLDATDVANPNSLLLANDLVTIEKADGTVSTNFTISSVNVDGVTVVVSATAAAFAAGDLLYLRPATAPSLAILTPFLWSRTEFRFAATASAALSATHTPLEEGSNWTLMHDFKDDNGEHRSGSQEPYSLVRVQANVEAQVKKFFDTLNDQNAFQGVLAQALVIRHFSGTGYELRVTLNDIRYMEGVQPDMKSTEVLYSDIKVQPVYKAGDGQAFDVVVINNLATI